MQRYLLGIDLGSSSIRAAIYALDGTPVAIASRPTEKVTPDPSRPGEIVWPHARIWNNGCEAIREAIAKLPAGAKVEALAVACLGMDGLPVDSEGRELYDFISWHDTRTVPQYEAWRESFGEERQFLATGNQLYTFNTAFRLQWMARHKPDILARTSKWVLIGDYFNFKLCGRLATDYTMAGCTLLFDARAKDWSAEVLAAAGIDRRLLCDPLPSGTVLGGVSKEAAEATGLPEGTPVVLGAHDYLCGVLPVGGHQPGTIVNVAGTWDVVQATAATFDPNKAMVGRGMTYECHAAPGLYSILGAAIGGGILDWYRAELGAAHGENWDRAQTEALERGPNGLLFLPHIAGANCPDADPFAAGALVGLRNTHSRADILAAVCQGLAFQNAAIVQALEECGVAAERMVLVGGGGRNSAAVRTRANILGRPIETSPLEETTALGAAMLAGVGSGVYRDLDAAYSQVSRPATVTQPDAAASATFRRYMPHYSALYAALRSTHHALAGR
jgi:xylulokinase